MTKNKNNNNKNNGGSKVAKKQTPQQPQQQKKQTPQQPAKQQPTKQQPAKQQQTKLQPTKQQPTKQQPTKQPVTKKQTTEKPKETTTDTTPTTNTSNNPIGMEDDLFEEISTLQVEIENISNKEMQQKLKLDIERDRELSPIYVEREQLLSKIPNFWYETIKNHPILNALIDTKDVQLLKHLTNFKVDIMEGGNVKFTFTFGNNSFIKNKTIWKEYVFETESMSTNSSPIQWKNGNDITKKKEGEDPSFFSWFSDQDDLEIFDIFKHEIWMFPQDFFNNKLE